MRPRCISRPAGRTALAAALALACVLPAAGPALADTGAGMQKREWALRDIHAEDAWKAAPPRAAQGRGVTVAVLDTGVDATHPDLRGSVARGRDMVGIGARRGDKQWARHGTAMAGIIAGHGHGPGGSEGVLGVAPKARILPVRVLLEDADPKRAEARKKHSDALAKGIRWAADHGADVINLSLGDDSSSARPVPSEDAAVRYALAKGCVLVASAGNGGQNGDRISYPAAYPGVLAVTAVDKYNARADFSTRRWYATVAAPGKDVVIADPDRRYYEGWGTSAAAAYVSGSVALIRAAYPRLSPAQIKSLVASTAQNTPAGGRSDALGTGIVDPAAAIEMAANIRPAPEKPATIAYGSEYFGPGPDRSTDWFALVAAVLGVLLIAAAWGIHRGVDAAQVREVLRRLPSRLPRR